MGVMFALLNAAGLSVTTVMAKRGQQKGCSTIIMGLYTTLLVSCAVHLLYFAVSAITVGVPEINRNGILCFICGGVFNSLIGRMLLFYSIDRIGAVRCGIIKSTTPVFVIFGSVLVLSEKITWKQWIGILIVLAGVFTISYDALCKEVPGSEDKNRLWGGVAIGLASSAFLAVGNLFRKSGINYIPSPSMGVAVGSTSALIALTIMLLLFSGKDVIKRTVRHPDESYAIGGLSTALALASLFCSLERIPLSIANSLSAVEPVFTMIFGRLILGQKANLTVPTIFGAIMAVAGAAILALS